MKRIWALVIVLLTTVDVAGAAYLWWLVDQRSAGTRATPQHARNPAAPLH